jgi:hypothetical protein
MMPILNEYISGVKQLKTLNHSMSNNIMVISLLLEQASSPSKMSQEEFDLVFQQVETIRQDLTAVKHILYKLDTETIEEKAT